MSKSCLIAGGRVGKPAQRFRAVDALPDQRRTLAWGLRCSVVPLLGLMVLRAHLDAQGTCLCPGGLCLWGHEHMCTGQRMCKREREGVARV